MRKLTAILASLLLALPSIAQQKPHTWSITPKVGITSSKFSKNTPFRTWYFPINNLNAIDSRGLITKHQHETGFIIGAEVKYQFNKTFGLSLGALYAQQGRKWDAKEIRWNVGYSPTHPFQPFYDEYPSDYTKIAEITFYKTPKYQYNTLNIPILANFYLWKGLAIKAGLEPQITISQKIKNGPTLTTVDPEDKEYIFLYETTCKCRNFNLAAPIGISYEYKNICTDIQYHHGITHVMHNGADNITTQLFTFTVGYKL